jgi:acetyl-CoA carboxylase biotin carboxyl carrier protein
MDIAEIEHIIKVLKENGITDFELKRADGELKLRREEASAPSPSQSHHGELFIQPLVSAPQSLSASAIAPSHDSHLLKVESPIVGTFYRKPSPDREVFVNEGDYVKKGDTICIVEAMKLMNEIEAPFTGKIEKIIPQDGEVVEFGEIMFLINPT